ncbi:hypothetical protein EH223_07045, partial [candidate division KSB1 bacterium]
MENQNSSDERDKPPSSGLDDTDQYEAAQVAIASQAIASQMVLTLPGKEPRRFSPQRESFTHSTPPNEKSKPNNKKLYVIGERTARFRARHYATVSDEQWNDWRWQLRNRIKDLQGLENLLILSESERQAVNQHTGPLPVSITPYYASLIDPENPRQPIRRTVVSVNDEYHFSPEESIDPLGEDGHSPVPGLVHRYPDRVLFLVT